MTCPDYSGTSPFHLCLQEAAIDCLAVALQQLPVEILAVPHPQFLFPLFHAVQTGNKEACQLLIRAGADVNQVRQLTAANSEINFDLTQVDNESGRGPLHLATEMNHSDLVDLLISCGAQLDATDVRGLTPLHLACIVEGVGSLEAIISRVGGGDVLDIQDSQGLTPLMRACVSGNAESTRLLLKKKVRITERTVEYSYKILKEQFQLNAKS